MRRLDMGLALGALILWVAVWVGSVHAQAGDGADPPMSQGRTTLDGTGSGLEPLPDDPLAVTRRYLELGSLGRLEEARELVEPRCHGEPEGEVAALDILGARLRIRHLQVQLVELEAARAAVEYTARGSVRGEALSTTLEVFGSDVRLDIDSLDIDEMSISDRLALVRMGERWLISCAHGP